MNMKSVCIIMLTMSILGGCGEIVATPAGPAMAGDEGPVSAGPEGPSAGSCLESGNQDTINARLVGVAAVAMLCPGAVFELTGPVRITADKQQIYTEGFPTDDTRATLRIVSRRFTAAVIMRDYNEVLLSHVIVDGNRVSLEPMGGDALVYAGGYSRGQIIRGNKIMNTRSWSSLQLIQGHSDSQPCSDALVEMNEIGPAGTSDNLLWADGISLACTNSIVRDNTITDATDGAIVVFAAPGSLIERNTIRAETRTLLGGINMVDAAVYGGDYTGTIVRENIIDASGAVIRIGLGMGTRVWGCVLPYDSGDSMIRGGTVTGNTLRGQYMQYGFAVDGVSQWTVTGNIDEAVHSGRPSVDCGGRLASAPAGFQYNPAHSEGVFQPEFAFAQLDLALWAIPSPRPGE
jgi:Right handed beta helix region